MEKKKAIWKKWWFWLIIVVVIAAASQGGKDEPKKVEADNNKVETMKEVKKEKEKETEAEKETVFKKGDVVELKNIKATLVDVKESKGTEFNKPTDGNIFVLAEFLIENESDKELAISSMVSFEAYVDGYSTNLDLGALIEKDNGNQLDGKIAPGKKMKGFIGYQVPKEWKELEIKFSPSVWGDPITFTYSK